MFRKSKEHIGSEYLRFFVSCIWVLTWFIYNEPCATVRNLMGARNTDMLENYIYLIN